jgi:hypothetical protein
VAPLVDGYRPRCRDCGGALAHDGERCRCGGLSIFYVRQAPAPAEVPPPEPKRLHAVDALIQLYERRQPP